MFSHLVDVSIRQKILYNAHDRLTAGHLGAKKTHKIVSRLYYWPGLQDYCAEYVARCVQCRQSKALTQRPGRRLQPLRIPCRLWEKVSLDLITDLPPTKRGNGSILVIVDYLSKMAHFNPTTKELDADGLCELIADKLCRYHGVPRKNVSDCDPRLIFQARKLFCARFDVQHSRSTAFHP